MQRLSLVHEDALRPIARVGDTLWFFSQQDGRLYALLPAGVRTTTASGPLFIVPGDAEALCFHLNGNDRLEIERLILTERGKVERSHSVVHRVPDSEDNQLSGLVASESGSRTVLLTTSDPSRTVGVEVGSGATRTIRHPEGTAVARILNSGALVLAGGDGYVVQYRDRDVQGTGTIIATTEEAVLIRKDSKDHRSFWLIEDGRRRPLRTPEGWSPLQAAFDMGGEVQMICLHPEQGYGLWHVSQHSVHCLQGSAQLFPLERASPVLRVVSAVHGSIWMNGPKRWPGAAAPCPAVSAERVQTGGMPCILLSGSGPSPRSIVVAFHGGPDSHEWDDLRYGGSYRELIARGLDVLVVNYPGSAHLGVGLHSAAWEQWPQVATGSACAVAKFCRLRGYRDLIAFGVSFGAWFAAMSADELGAVGVVALSPILAMSPHLRVHSDRDPAFAEWAHKRFGPDYHSAAEGDEAVAQSRTRIVAIVPVDDEVVDASNAVPAEFRNVETRSVPGHHYPRTLADADTRWATLVRSIEDFALRASDA